MVNLKHLSSIAEDVVLRCAKEIDNPVEKLVEEFEEEHWKPETGSYSKKLVEFCSAKAVNVMCCNVEEKISDGSFSRFTYDMMLAWEMPSFTDEESHAECMAKEKEEKNIPVQTSPEDEISLFYSDKMPLLVDDQPDVGEDAFVWLGSLVPLAADVVNGGFTFETLTAPTGNRLHFPAYDLFLKEIDKCTRHLQKQAKPKGVVFADDEYILHVEGTASTQRVVRHIGGTSWPGRLTLSNYALYFEASGVITYEDALKIELSKNVEHTVKPAATGPWGAPLFDKAIVYESPELSEEIVLEFPELTSSTRRDHWLALTKEIMLLHRFLSKYKLQDPIQEWEMHSRTILGIIRLHAAREMLRISPPSPTKFLIFSLYNEIPKGDYVLEELANSQKQVNSGHPCSASSILRSMNMSIASSANMVEKEEEEEEKEEQGKGAAGLDADTSHSLLETAIEQAREEEKEIAVAKASAEELKEEGISDSAAVLMELLKPLKSIVPRSQEIFKWEKPLVTATVIAVSLTVIYKEWVGKAMAVFFVWLIAKMRQARRDRLYEKCNEIVVFTASEQSTMESIVSAQQGLYTFHDLVQMANIAILKIWSVMISKAQKHADITMMAMTGIAILLAIIPFKVILMGIFLSGFIPKSQNGKSMEVNTNLRRLKEWWDSIPVIPVRIVDKVPEPTASDTNK